MDADEALLVVALVLANFIGLIVWRWLWIRSERNAIRRMRPEHDDSRFEGRGGDEDDQLFFGKVIRRMRAHLIGGRVEINWQYMPQFIHRGFWLTGKCRRNDGPWEALAFEPYQDSGAWHECFNLYESRSYLFVVRKTYRFFFGLLDEPESEEVFDQISFSVRKGKFLREIKEIIDDRTKVLGATAKYAKQLAELRSMGKRFRDREDSPASEKSPAVSKLESRHKLKREVAEYVARETAIIEAQPWDDPRKRAEIDALEQLAEQTILEAEA